MKPKFLSSPRWNAVDNLWGIDEWQDVPHTFYHLKLFENEQCTLIGYPDGEFFLGPYYLLHDGNRCLLFNPGIHGLNGEVHADPEGWTEDRKEQQWECPNCSNCSDFDLGICLTYQADAQDLDELNFINFTKNDLFDNFTLYMKCHICGVVSCVNSYECA